MAQLAEQLICNQQVNGSSPFIGFMDGFPSGQRGQTVNLLAPPSKVRILLHPLNLITRGGAVWKLVGLITRRSQVRVLPPQPITYGPLVKRSRHRPFTAVTGVRFPYGSPFMGL